MFDINTIAKTTCLICRDNLFDITERDSNKKITKKEYKIYLKPITRLECGHYYHIECLKAAYLVESKGFTYNFSKKCPYCSNKINRINPLFNELDSKNELSYEKAKREVKRIKNEELSNKKSRCISITNSGTKCKLYECSPGSKYCRIHSKKNEEQNNSESKEDTSIFSNVIGSDLFNSSNNTFVV